MFLAGIKKEFKLFSRGFKLLGVIILVVGIAVAYPVMYKFMEIMTQQLAEMGAELGGEMETATSSMTGMMDGLAQMYGGSLGAVGFYTGVTGMTGEGFLIIALLLMATAGGEQKKRSIIMPNCAGLTPAGYILPKFAIYPLLMGAFAFAGTLLCSVITYVLYGEGIPMENVLFSGGCASFYMVFMISAYMLFGICTGRPGVGVITMYLSTALIPLILQVFNISKYNPFALTSMILETPDSADMTNYVMSIVVSLILSVICCLVSLVVTSLRKIDNAQGEANL